MQKPKNLAELRQSFQDFGIYHLWFLTYNTLTFEKVTSLLRERANFFETRAYDLKPSEAVLVELIREISRK
jgi:hypothetical protein